MLEQGPSARTVVHSHQVLNRALKDAAKWGLLHNDPAQVASPPRIDKKEAITRDSPTFKRFLAAGKDSR